jgi:hypothetical protein
MQGNLFGAASLTPPWAPAPSPAVEEAPATVETVSAFENNLESELSKLRRAIHLLDQAFAARQPESPAAEPSYADLVSDTARQRRR